MTAETLRPWGGRIGRWQYRDAAEKKLLIAPDGSIYAHDYRGQLYIWCPAVQLVHHLIHLRRIHGDAVVVDLSEQAARALRITAGTLYSMAAH